VQARNPCKNRHNKVDIGEPLTFDQPFSLPIYGKDILVYVDAYKTVDELNESNNITSIVIQQLK
jgi:hypothetical protein